MLQESLRSDEERVRSSPDWADSVGSTGFPVEVDVLLHERWDSLVAERGLVGPDTMAVTRSNARHQDMIVVRGSHRSTKGFEAVVESVQHTHHDRGANDSDPTMRDSDDDAPLVQT